MASREPCSHLQKSVSVIRREIGRREGAPPLCHAIGLQSRKSENQHHSQAQRKKRSLLMRAAVAASAVSVAALWRMTQPLSGTVSLSRRENTRKRLPLFALCDETAFAFLLLHISTTVVFAKDCDRGAVRCGGCCGVLISQVFSPKKKTHPPYVTTCSYNLYKKRQG